MERSAKRRQGDQARSMEWGAKRRRTGGNDGTAGGTSSTHTSTEGQEVATSWGYNCEVFLSFRGPDTRAGFTDFLYTKLDDAGIRTFKDDEELRIGEEFAPELLQAINQSKISIPIFSKGYASSAWCLKELVQMVECWKNGRQKIMPIFYDVAPPVVRYQTGIYAEAFLSHEEKQRYGKDTICEWKAALSAVGAINGWDLHSKTNRQEGEFAKEVTEEVFRELKKAYLAVSDCLVSVDDQVEKFMEMIGAQTSETRIIGIYGMGGIGKTTIAKIIYNRLSSNFKDCCFLSNIRETSKHKGIECLQNQLISGILKLKQMDINNVDEGIETIKNRLSTKRVLLLLDDVEGQDHMNALIGNHDWFGKGSKIIITTRKKDILSVPKVDCSDELKCMDPNQSLQLFSKHAFRRDSPLDEFIDQSKRAIGIAGGLPLALEVMGSFLSGKDKIMWDATLKMLESVPHLDVQKKLKISYDALDDRQKHIFLDIACFFIGYDKDIMVYFWDESKFPEVALEVLQIMSLIKIKHDNKVWMHDQLRDLGREMARQESEMKIEKQSRVWDTKDALDLLRRHEGKIKVEALRFHFGREQQYRFTCKDFERLSNLRFLRVDGSKEYFRAEERLLWHESSSNVFQENSNLLPQLLWLSWPGIAPTFKITNFSMEYVVILDLSRSKITHDWKGWSHMKVMKNLKVMDLNNCYCLKRTPHFPAHSKLERLILWGCSKLVKIDRSICQLKSLVYLDIGQCGSLRRLPDEMGSNLASLECLLTYVGSLERLPNTIGNLESLIELDISYTEIKELPDSIGQLKNLKVVNMNWGAIEKIPDAFWTIETLEEININKLDGFEFDVKIGDCIYRNRSLRILKLMHARIDEVPRLPESLITLELSRLYMDSFPNLSNLTNLKNLALHSDGESDGAGKKDLPWWIGNLSNLESLELYSPCMTTSSIDIRSLLPQLKKLYLDCPNLRCLPSLPSSLSSLNLDFDCVTTLPTDMSSLLPQLKDLTLWKCPKLRCLPSLPSSLSFLILVGCKSLSSLGDLSNLNKLSYLDITDCAISEIRGLDRLENLGSLRLQALPQVEILPDLRNLNKLWCLKVSDCGNLVEIQGELRPSLQELGIWGCGSLQKLPDLLSPKGLWKVQIKCCGKLNVETISSLCSEKGVKFEGDDSKSGCEFDCESEGEDDKSRCEFDYESKGEDDESGCEFEYGYEGEDDESGCKFDYESEGEDEESGCKFEYGYEGEDDESGCKFDYESEGEDDESGCEFEYGSEG